MTTQKITTAQGTKAITIIITIKEPKIGTIEELKTILNQITFKVENIRMMTEGVDIKGHGLTHKIPREIDTGTIRGGIIKKRVKVIEDKKMVVMKLDVNLIQEI